MRNCSIVNGPRQKQKYDFLLCVASTTFVSVVNEHGQGAGSHRCSVSMCETTAELWVTRRLENQGLFVNRQQLVLGPDTKLSCCKALTG